MQLLIIFIIYVRYYNLKIFENFIINAYKYLNSIILLII